MIDYFFDLKDIFPYLYCFPILLFIIFIMFVIGKRKINDKGIAFYGIFMSLTNTNIVSITLLCLYYYFIIVSIFINNFTILIFLILIIPIVLFDIINFYFIKFFIDIINTIVIFVLIYSKVIFYNYMIDVGSFWYVIVLYVMLCLFIYLYATFIFVRRFKSIMSKNKYVEKKK